MSIGPELKTELIAELQNAVQSASRDYFLWTRGRILYDDGVEALMQVYAGKRIFELFAPQYGLDVRLERRISEIDDQISGRADLTVQFDGGDLYIIEFKRYTSAGSIAGDIERLRKLAIRANTVCWLAAPCFIKVDQTDWSERFAQQLAAQDSTLKPYLSESRFLPSRFRHTENWKRDRALIIEVVS